MARNKDDKETAAKKAELSDMVGHYQSGFAVGNREGLEWAWSGPSRPRPDSRAERRPTKGSTH